MLVAIIGFITTLLAAITQWLRYRQAAEDEDEQTLEQLVDEVEELEEQVAEHEQILAAIRREQDR